MPARVQNPALPGTAASELRRWLKFPATTDANMIANDRAVFGPPHLPASQQYALLPLQLRQRTGGVRYRR
jgi:hypothetical protein